MHWAGGAWEPTHKGETLEVYGVAGVGSVYKGEGRSRGSMKAVVLLESVFGIA